MDISRRQALVDVAPSVPARTAWRKTAVILVGLALLTFALWLPFGWNVSPLLDGWVLLRRADLNDLPIFYPQVSPTRPLTYAPWVISTLLTPESFVAQNVLYALALFGTGAAMYGLLRRLLPDHQVVAWFGAALLIVFPADHGIFYLDAINIRFSLMFTVIAVYGLLLYWEHRTPLRLLLMLGAQIISLLMYEVGIPLLLFLPLLLLWMEHGRFSRRWWGISALWSAFPLVWLGNIIVSMINGSAVYQNELLDTSGAAANLINGILFVYRQNLWTGFALGWSQIPAALAGELPLIFLGLAVLIGGIVGLAGWSRSHAQLLPTISTRRALWLTLWGLVALIAGFAMYIPTADFNNIHYIWRLYYFTSFGATIALLAGLLLLLNLRRPLRLVVFAVALFALITIAQPLIYMLLVIALGVLLALPRRAAFVSIAALLVGLAVMRGLEQHQGQAGRGEDQKRLAAAVISQAPAVPDGTLLLVLDGSTTGELRAFGFNYAFEYALALTYGHHRYNGRICYYVRPRPTEFCRFEDGQVVVPGTWIGEETYPYEQVVAFRYDENNGMVLLDAIPEPYLSGVDASTYDPHALIDADAPPPSRLFTMLEGAD
jgi:hypothetical protein